MKKTAIIFLIVFLILSSLLIVNFKLKKTVTVIDGQKVIEIKTFKKTVESLFEAEGFNMASYDRVDVPLSSEITDKMVIEIQRGFPVVLRIDGEERRIYTHKQLVRHFLENQSVVLGSLDQVSKPMNDFLDYGDVIEVIRIDEKYVETQERVPFYTIVKRVTSLSAGDVENEQDGKIGLKHVTYRVKYKNGEEISREKIEEEIIEEPQNEIIYKGIDQMFVNSRGVPFDYREVIVMEATAYDLSYQSTGKRPGDRNYGITFSGTQARPGVVAVDPKVIPLGASLYIESLDQTKDYGFAIAEDTGSAIKGNRIDLFINDFRKAMKYGRHNVRVYVLNQPVKEEQLEGYSGRQIYD